MMDDLTGISDRPTAATAPRVHRYRGSRPWSVAAFATLSSLAAVLMAGAVAASVTDVGTRQREQLGLSLRELIGAGPARPAFATSGGWRIQVGTFRSRAAAVAKLDATARSVPELAQAGAVPQPYGALTRARFVGLPDEGSAAAVCAKVAAGGTDCYVLPPR